MGDSHMGLQARLMSQALRKLTAVTRPRPGAEAAGLGRAGRHQLGLPEEPLRFVRG